MILLNFTQQCTNLNYFFFFFFLLHAAFKVATNWSAILSKSASRSLFSSSVRTRGAGGTGFVAGSNFFPRSVSDIISFILSSDKGATSVLVSSSSSGGGEKTTSLSSRSRLISRSKDSSSRNRRVSGVPSKLPSLLLARAEVRAMALLSPAATLVRSRRAAVAANALLCNYIGAGISMFHFYVDFLISLSQFSQLSLSPLLYISLHTLHLPPHLHLHLNLPCYLYLTSLHRKQSQNGGEQFPAFCLFIF